MADPLSIASGVAGLVSLGITVTQGIVAYYSSWKDCPSDVSNTVQSLSNLSEILKRVRATYESGQLHPGTRASIEKSVWSCQAIIKKLQTKLEKFPRDDKGKPGERFGFLIQRGLYPFKESTLAKLRELVSDLRANIDTVLTHASLEASLSTQSGISHLQYGEDRKLRLQILAWLSDADFAQQQQGLLERHQMGTGAWFTSSDEFTQWVNGPEKLLYCPGDPGTGKTFMACHVVNSLAARTYAKDTDAVCVVYCNYTRQDQQTILYAISSILRQIVAKLDSVPQPVLQLYDRAADSKMPLTLAECTLLLQQLRVHIARLYIVVDALDEFSTRDNARNRFCDFLLELTDTVDAKLMVTSRNVEQVSVRLSKGLIREIRASQEDVGMFLDTYLQDRCDNPVIVRSETLKNEVKNAILESIDGMFLLARLQVMSLSDKRSARKVREALGKLSAGDEGLQNAYRSAVTRIDGQLSGLRGIARQVIAWTTLARSPLSIRELQHALALDSDDDEFDEDSITPADMITSACAGLVINDTAANLVRFVHYSTQEFFQEFVPQWIPEAKEILAKTCLAYTSLSVGVLAAACRHPRGPRITVTSESETQTPICKILVNGEELEDLEDNAEEAHGLSVDDEIIDHHFDETFEDLPLMKYAAKNAGWHANQDPGRSWHQTAMTLLCDQTRCFLLLTLISDDWYYLQKHEFEKCDRADGSSWGMKIAVRYGFADMIDPLARHGVPVFPKNGEEAPPLNDAIQSGQVEIVKRLTSAGAVREAMNGPATWSNPLIIAASTCTDSEILRVLLTCESVDVNFQTPQTKNTSLMITSGRGSIGMTKLLLEAHGIDVNCKNNEKDTAMGLAAKNGHTEVLKMLLQTEGILTTEKNNDGRTPLALAAQAGHAEIVEILFSRDGLHLSSLADTYNLQASSAHGSSEAHEEALRLLFRTPLQEAVRLGQLHQIELLIQHGADVNQRDEDGDSPLLTSVRCEQTRAAAILLGCHADVNFRNGLALHIAVHNNSQEMVQLLLEHGADTEASVEQGKTFLMFAAVTSRIDLLRSLLDRKAHTDTCDDEGRTALIYAVMKENPPATAIITMLLEHGADIDAGGPPGRAGRLTPLILAARWGNIRNVQLLLEHGAKTDIRDCTGRTAVAWAACRTFEDTVKVLAERRADVNIADEAGITPLMLAADRSGRGTVEVLLKHGARVDQKDCKGKDACEWAKERGAMDIVHILREAATCA